MRRRCKRSKNYLLHVFVNYSVIIMRHHSLQLMTLLTKNYINRVIGASSLTKCPSFSAVLPFEGFTLDFKYLSFPSFLKVSQKFEEGIRSYIISLASCKGIEKKSFKYSYSGSSCKLSSFQLQTFSPYHTRTLKYESSSKITSSLSSYTSNSTGIGYFASGVYFSNAG